MTERGRASVRRDAASFVVGPSRLDWRDGELTIEFDEVTAPWPKRVRGRVRVRPRAISRYAAALDSAGRHRWGPIAPAARVDVELDRPRSTWSGPGYFDSNEGDEPVDAGFTRWDWSRASLSGGRTAVVYDVRGHAGDDRVLSLAFGREGEAQPLPLPAPRALRPSAWRIARRVHADAGRDARVERSLEDGPFYSRAVVSYGLDGEAVTGMHETLDCARLVSPVVRMMLPVKMPRRR